MTYPQAIIILTENLANAPDTRVTALAKQLIEGAMAYDDAWTRLFIEERDFPGGIKRNFAKAADYTDDLVLHAPWSDPEADPLQSKEHWNRGRRASLTGVTYDLDGAGLPVNPYLRTGVRGRGIVGLFGPNHAVDVGALTVMPDEAGVPALHAYGIMKGGVPAFCGGFTEYEEMDEHGYVTGRDIWHLNQAKEFFEEMVSGSVTLIEPYAGRLAQECDEELTRRVNARGGVPLPDRKVREIREQIATGLKLEQIRTCDPGFFDRLLEIMKKGQECYKGPIRSSSRNTDTSWMETYLSWIVLDEGTWDYIKGENPSFDYQLAAGDDADDVVAHRIDKKLLEQASGTHSAMFVFMAAAYVLDQQQKGKTIQPEIMTQLEQVSDFLAPFVISEASAKLSPNPNKIMRRDL